MTDIPSASSTQDYRVRAAADLEKVRAAAKAGYEGMAGTADVSEAVKRREHRRAERERRAYKAHYLGMPQKPD